MKKYFLTALALCLGAVSGLAQSSQEIISRIEESLAAGSDISEAFSEKRTPKGSASTTLEGTLTFKAPDYLLMDYSNGEKFLIDHNKITVKKGGKEQTLDAQKNLMMKGLTRALTYALQGKISALSAEQDAEVSATKEQSSYKVVLSARKKAAKGYARMTVFYRASDCAIRSMCLEEFTGLITDYCLK